MGIITSNDGCFLLQLNLQRLSRSIVIRFNAQSWRSWLLIPSHELREIPTGYLRHRLNEFVNGHSLPIMPVKIKIAALPE